MVCFYEMIKDKFLGKHSLMNCVGYDKFLFHELYVNKTAFVFWFFSPPVQSDKPVIRTLGFTSFGCANGSWGDHSSGL